MRRSDIIDLWSIAKLKAERINGPEHEAEHARMAALVAELPDPIGGLPTGRWMRMLYAINAAIWQAEASVKGAKDALPNEHSLFAPENRDELIHIGFAAIMIRNYNNIRCQTKNMLAELMNEAPIEQKKDHASQSAEVTA